MRSLSNKYALALIFIFLTCFFSVSGCVDTGDYGTTEKTEINQEDIINIQWQWSAMSNSGIDEQLIVPDPQSYTLVFLPDNRYLIKADCNQGSGSYSLEGNDLTIEPGPITLAYCGDQSLDAQYLAALNNVTSVTIENEQLVLYTGDNEGKMAFDNGGVFENGS